MRSDGGYRVRLTSLYREHPGGGGKAEGFAADGWAKPSAIPACAGVTLFLRRQECRLLLPPDDEILRCNPHEILSAEERSLTGPPRTPPQDDGSKGGTPSPRVAPPSNDGLRIPCAQHVRPGRRYRQKPQVIQVYWGLNAWGILQGGR